MQDSNNIYNSLDPVLDYIKGNSLDDAIYYKLICHFK